MRDCDYLAQLPATQKNGKSNFVEAVLYQLS